MHDLENLNIPIIGCLMEDKAMGLTIDAQRTIVRWAITKAMVQDAMDTRNRSLFYTEPERAALRSNTRLPVYTNVWLGRSSLKTLACDGFDLGVDIDDGTAVPEMADGCVTTIVVGHLAIQIATFHVPDKYTGRPFGIRHAIQAPWEHILVPLLASEGSVNWPPRFSLIGDEGIKGLNARFRGGIDRTA